MRRKPVIILLALLAALVLGACGSSSSSSSGGSSSDNGVASKSPAEIVSAAQSAVAGVNSVHVSGSVTSSGSPISLDLNLVNGKGGRGSMSVNGLSFQIVALTQEIYINAPSSFWKHFGGNAAAQLLSGKWLKAPANGQFASFASLTNLNQLFSKLLSSHGTLSNGGTTTVNGQKVVAVKDSSQGGTLYVAATGKPYPVRVIKSGSDGGRVDFDKFNQSVSLSPPANAIDISQLK
jgi:hypothetical protein